VAFNTITITTTATKIVSANPNRQSLILANVGTGTVYLGPDDTVTKDNGVPLLQDGTFTEDDGGSRMFMGDVWGIVEASTSDLRYWERVR
jgi:hypothetical protein